MWSATGPSALGRAAALACCAFALQGYAAAPGDTAEPRPRVTLLLHAGDELERADLANAAERLGELDVEVASELEDTSALETTRTTARRIARQHRTLGVLWLGNWRADRTLFLHESRTDYTLGRRLPRSGNPAADREELAIVVRGTVAALLEGHALEMEQVQTHDLGERDRSAAATPPAPANEPRASRASSDAVYAGGDSRVSLDTRLDRNSAALEWALRAGYLGMSRLVEGGDGWDSGASLGLRAWLPLALHAELAYGFLPATNVSVASTSASFSRHPLTLAFGASHRDPTSAWRWLAAELVFTVDRVSRSTAFAAAGLEPTDDESRWLMSGGARVGAAAGVARGVNVYALLGAERVFNRLEYVVRDPSTEQRFGLAPLSVKAELGVSVELTSSASEPPR